MAVFEYKGFDKAGKAVTGIIDADNPKVARIKLRKQSIFPTDVHIQKKGGGIRGSGLDMEIDVESYFQFVSKRDISILTRQMATLVGANVPMAETLNALVEQSEKQKLKVVLSEVKERVNEGSTLADALGAHPKIFDNLFVQMVRAGERSGSLAPVLKRLAGFAEASVKMQGKLRGAMIYPIIMAVVGLTILIGLFTYVVPQLKDLIEGINQGKDVALPWVTQLVFFFGDLLTSWWSILIAILLVSGYLGFQAWIRRAGKKWWHGVLLKLPVVGKLNRMVAVSRFCRTLSTLLTSGVPIITALGIVKSVIGNVVLESAVEDASANIQEGQSISAPLKRSGQFPPMVTHMIAIGERTGELENMLVSVADAYESEVSTAIEAFASILGPVMIVVLGGVIFVVALGLLLPVANLTNSVF